MKTLHFMKLKITALSFLLFSTFTLSAQEVFRVDAPDGIHHVTTEFQYPILGTYHYRGGDPIVELMADGNGYYQLHDQEKRSIIWGVECNTRGIPTEKKGFDNAAYTLWYKYTTRDEDDTDELMAWKPVALTVHFRTQKIFIQGERSKSYTGEPVRDLNGN